MSRPDNREKLPPYVVQPEDEAAVPPVIKALEMMPYKLYAANGQLQNEEIWLTSIGTLMINHERVKGYHTWVPIPDAVLELPQNVALCKERKVRWIYHRDFVKRKAIVNWNSLVDVPYPRQDHINRVAHFTSPSDSKGMYLMKSVDGKPEALMPHGIDLLWHKANGIQPSSRDLYGRPVSMHSLVNSSYVVN